MQASLGDSTDKVRAFTRRRRSGRDEFLEREVAIKLLGPDSGCCGRDGDGKGGCGRCVLVRARGGTARQSDWSAVVMKKTSRVNSGK